MVNCYHASQTGDASQCSNAEFIIEEVDTLPTYTCDTHLAGLVSESDVSAALKSAASTLESIFKIADPDYTREQTFYNTLAKSCKGQLVSRPEWLNAPVASLSNQARKDMNDKWVDFRAKPVGKMLQLSNGFSQN